MVQQGFVSAYDRLAEVPLHLRLSCNGKSWAASLSLRKVVVAGKLVTFKASVDFGSDKVSILSTFLRIVKVCLPRALGFLLDLAQGECRLTQHFENRTVFKAILEKVTLLWVGVGPCGCHCMQVLRACEGGHLF